MFELKLIGAETFSCMPLQIIAARAGDIVMVETENDRDYLLAQNSMDASNNLKPLFSEDLTARVTHKRRAITMPLEEALQVKPKLDRVQREKGGKVAEAQKAKRVRRAPKAK